jgi:uncharacterized GH25 family protein
MTTLGQEEHATMHNRTSRFVPTRLARAALLAVSALLPFAAQAHMTWLLPNANHVTGKEPVVSVDAAVSEDLFAFSRGLKLEAVRITAPDGTDVQAENRSSARHRDSFDFKLLKNGTYRISNVSRSMSASYKLGGETKRFRGSQEAFDKEVPPQAEVTAASVSVNRLLTFVSKEDPGSPKFVPEGDGLELVPLDPVTDLSNGDSSRFRLLLDGKPLPESSITLLREGNRYRYKLGEVLIKSDAKGEFSVAWTEAGRYWLGVNHGGRPPAPAGAAASGAAPVALPEAGTRQAPLKRASLSATFEVLPK